MKNQSHKTAISRNRWTKPGKWLYEHFFVERRVSVESMLDFGAGKSIDNECWSKETGAHSQAYDQFEQPNFPGRGIRPERQFSLVTVIFVLNVVSTDKERIEIIDDAMQYVAPNGYLFIATRSKKEIERARIRSEKKGNVWQKLESGAFISDPRKNTIQFGVDNQDIHELILESSHSHLKHIKLDKHPGSEIGCALFQNA
tara:strand:+ start:833 stop:1432 length:600 start_codon:yes stop_codon:yes gene_type:complete